MSLLLTGGAGYIGSHVARLLVDRGEEVVIVDDLVTGHAERVAGIRVERLSLHEDATRAPLAQLLRERGVDAVVHFAARKRVDESVAEPARYYRENLGGLANLLEAMRDAGTRTLVFSSSAAVYGDGDGDQIRETDPLRPINPYGETKLAGEWLVRAAAAADGLRATSLRYFNVAGAAVPELGDRLALNLVPMVFERLAAGEAPRVFGADYSTRDGTCIRDFIHVADLAHAHVLALDALRRGDELAPAYNVGTGRGSTVREVLAAIGRATGFDTTPALEPRRAGDIVVSVADPSLLERDLGWRASRDLDDMATSAWAGYRRNVLGETDEVSSS